MKLKRNFFSWSIINMKCRRKYKSLHGNTRVLERCAPNCCPERYSERRPGNGRSTGALVALRLALREGSKSANKIGKFQKICKISRCARRTRLQFQSFKIIFGLRQPRRSNSLLIGGHWKTLEFSPPNASSFISYHKMANISYLLWRLLKPALEAA